MNLDPTRMFLILQMILTIQNTMCSDISKSKSRKHKHSGEVDVSTQKSVADTEIAPSSSKSKSRRKPTKIEIPEKSHANTIARSKSDSAISSQEDSPNIVLRKSKTERAKEETFSEDEAENLIRDFIEQKRSRPRMFTREDTFRTASSSGSGTSKNKNKMMGSKKLIKVESSLKSLYKKPEKSQVKVHNEYDWTAGDPVSPKSYPRSNGLLSSIRKMKVWKMKTQEELDYYWSFEEDHDIKFLSRVQYIILRIWEYHEASEDRLGVNEEEQTPDYKILVHTVCSEIQEANFAKNLEVQFKPPRRKNAIILEKCILEWPKYDVTRTSMVIYLAPIKPLNSSTKFLVYKRDVYARMQTVDLIDFDVNSFEIRRYKDSYPKPKDYAFPPVSSSK